MELVAYPGGDSISGWPQWRVPRVKVTGVFVADLQQQFGPDIEVLVVSLQVLVKEWERLQIGARSGGDLGAYMADQIQCCKVLAVPLPHAKDIQPGRIRDAGLFKDVAQVRCGAGRLRARRIAHTEAVQVTGGRHVVRGTGVEHGTVQQRQRGQRELLGQQRHVGAPQDHRIRSLALEP